jgi:hypothetical protein
MHLCYSVLLLHLFGIAIEMQSITIDYVLK